MALAHQPRTMAEKVWNDHVVVSGTGEGGARQPDLIYIDLHLVHEVTSPQAFDGLRMAGRRVRRPDLTVATADHNTPTGDLSLPIADEVSRRQIEALTRNCEEFGITLYDRHSPSQGIVHIIAPEQGYTHPGMSIVCGDSHTSTHGAFGAFAIRRIAFQRAAAGDGICGKRRDDARGAGQRAKEHADGRGAQKVLPVPQRHPERAH